MGYAKLESKKSILNESNLREDLTNYFKKHYPQLGTILSISQLSHNNINSVNFLIKTKNKKFVLKFFIDKSTPEKMNKICKIMNFCTKHKIKVPQPIQNNKRKFIDNKRLLYLTKYIEGTKFSGTKKEINDAAKQIANLHNILKACPIQYNYRTKQKSFDLLSDKELKMIQKSIRKKKRDKFDKIILKNINFISDSLIECRKFSKFLTKYRKEKQLIHYDLHQNNILFQQHKVSAIIDFQYLRQGHKIQDVVFCAFRLAEHNKGINEILNEIVFFINSYNKQNQLKKHEIESLSDTLGYEILSRLSYIIKERYFLNSDLKINDLQKFLKFLKIWKKISKKILVEKP